MTYETTHFGVVIVFPSCRAKHGRNSWICVRRCLAVVVTMFDDSDTDGYLICISGSKHAMIRALNSQGRYGRQNINID